MSQTVEWISHRGLCFAGTENTLAAFAYAERAGFCHFETDLRCTADGTIVLWHDKDLSRGSTDDRADTPIHLLEAKTVQTLRLHDGQTVASLDDLLNRFSERQWIFDIKLETAQQVIQQLHHRYVNTPKWKAFFAERVRFLLWSGAHQQSLSSIFPQARFMARLQQCRRAGLCNLLGAPKLGGIQPLQTYAIPPRFLGMSLMKRDFIARYHRQGARALAYLPESVEDIQLALDAGVDEILLNGEPVSQPKQ